MIQINIKRITNEIFNRVRILDYISDYYGVDFKLNGKTYQALCPIGHHDNKTRSFSIPMNEEFFNCFGCDAKGNVINFVEQYHGIDRLDAILKICQDVGINIEDSEEDKKYIEYVNNLKEKCKEYISELVKDDNALSYLKDNRNLSFTTIKNFRLGLSKKTLDNGINNDRITFPIQDNLTGDIIAFGYGYVGDKDNYAVSYINSSANNYFTKSDNFYGYKQALNEIRKTKEVYIVEGYFDVLSMHDCGLTNTLGVLCANISDSQIETLKRLKCKVNLLLDNDEAGESGIIKSIPRLMENNIDVKVIAVDGLKDADEICNKYKHNYNRIKLTLDKNTSDAVLFFISRDIDDYNNAVISMKRSIIKKIMPIIQLLPEVDKELYTKQIYKLLEI